MDRIKKGLGISWCATSDLKWTYYNQLAATTNPSFTARNYHTGTIAPNLNYTDAEITWYYKFRGMKPIGIP